MGTYFSKILTDLMLDMVKLHVIKLFSPIKIYSYWSEYFESPNNKR